MTAPMFSPARVAAVVVLSFLSAWYFGIMVGNSTPHGRDLQRQEQPLRTVGAGR